MKKNVLIIGGSDSVGGAGVQADIKTCEAFGCHAATAITAITAQNTQLVSAVLPATPELLQAQILAITEELDIHAVKVGMLFDSALVSVVMQWLETFERAGIKIIIDPVCVAKSGAKLLKDDALAALRAILPLATIITPNIDEAKILRLNMQKLPCDTLLKRTTISDICEDTLVRKSGEVLKFAEPLQSPAVMHGAGCSFSTALACLLANGSELEAAIKEAKTFVANAIKNAHESKFGVRLLNHKAALNG